MILRKRTLALLVAALASHSAAAAEAAANVAEATPDPNADAAAPDTLDTVQVVGTSPARYRSDDASGALGVETPVFNTPRSVVVLPEQTLLDQKITQLDEALKNVSGVSRGDGFGGTNDDFFIRGFRRDYVWRDGRRQTFNQRNSTTDIERIEVLKGPSSLTFGAIEPGGVVNIVTKQPQATPRHYVELTFDEYGKRHVLGDFTGPLNDDGTLLYRLAASREDSETFRDDKNVERTVVTPSLTWLPTDSDEVTLTANGFDEQLPIDRGAIVGKFADGERRIVETPRSRNFGEPWENSWSKGHTVDLRWRHAFSPQWSIEAGYAWQDTDSHDIQVRAWDYYAEDTVIGGRSIAAGTLIRNVAGNAPYDVTSRQYDARVNGKLDIGGMEYDLVVGADRTDSTIDAGSVSGFNETANIASGAPLFNVYAPVYGLLTPDAELVNRTSTDHDLHGVFVQNVLKPTESVLLTAGIRRDWYRVSSWKQNYDGGAPDGAASVADREWADNSYQLGASWEFVDGFALYASRATSFTVHPFFNDDPRSKPQSGAQWEGGLKGNLADDRVQFTLAWFDLTKTNIPTFNPDYDGTNERYRFIGEARSKGIEFDATLRLAPGLNVIASYADFDYAVSKDPDPTLIGKTNANVAPRSGNVWGTYEFQQGAWKGLGFGAGVNYVSDRWGDDDNTWKIPSYTLFDAGAWYYLPVGSDSSLRFQVTVKNIGDKRWYYASDGDRFAPSVNIGQPRTALFSVAYQF